MQKHCSPKVRVRQHLSLLGPILSALTALWKHHFASPFQNVFPCSLALSLSNYRVSCAAASARTDRQDDFLTALEPWHERGQGCWAFRMLLFTAACTGNQFQTSPSSSHRSVCPHLAFTLSPPTWLFAIVLMWAVYYWKWIIAVTTGFPTSVSAYRGYNTKSPALLPPTEKRRDLQINWKQQGWSLSYLLLSNAPQIRGPATKSCHLLCPTIFP